MCKDCGCGEDNGVVTKVFTVPGDDAITVKKLLKVHPLVYLAF